MACLYRQTMPSAERKLDEPRCRLRGRGRPDKQRHMTGFVYGSSISWVKKV